MIQNMLPEARLCCERTRMQLGGADPDALRLFSDLQGIITFLGEVYSEASGHCAATAKVVSDLRRSLTYIQASSRVGVDEVQLTAGLGRALSPSPGTSQGAYHAQPPHALHSPSATGSPAGSALRRDPAAAPAASERRLSPACAAPTPGPASSLPLNATRRRVSPAATPPAKSSLRSPSPPGPRTAAAATRVPGTTPRALPRAGVPKTPTTPIIPVARSALTVPPLATFVFATPSPEPAQPQKETYAAPAPAPSASCCQMPGQWRRALRQYEDVVQGAVRAAAFSASGTGRPPEGQAAAVPTAASLGLTGRSAGVMHQSTHTSITTGLSQSVEEASGAFTTRLSAMYEAAASAAAAGDPPGGAGLGGGVGRGKGSGRAAGRAAVDGEPGGVEDAQRLFASVVAAQTWILNALRQLAAQPRQGAGAANASTSAGVSSSAVVMGISAEGLFRLLQDLRVARMELAEAIDLLQSQKPLRPRASDLGLAATEVLSPLFNSAPAASASSPSQSSSAASGGRRPHVVPRRGSGKKHAAGHLGAAAEAEAVEAALRWRNRFLRAMAAGQHRIGSKSVSGSRTSLSGAVRQPLNRSRQGVSPEALPPSAMARHRLTAASDSERHADPKAEEGLLLMPRPLGLWLPDACWSPAVEAHAQQMRPATVSVECVAGVEPLAALFESCPWLLALPPNLLQQGSSARDREDLDGEICSGLQQQQGGSGGTGGPRRHFSAGPARGAPDDPAEREVSLGRARQSLQQCLMQLQLESVLAARLMPLPPPLTLSGPGGGERTLARPASSSSSGHPRSAGAEGNPHSGWLRRERDVLLERHLARCRLAHLFLSKGAWNRQCCVVQVVEELRQE